METVYLPKTPVVVAPVTSHRQNFIPVLSTDRRVLSVLPIATATLDPASSPKVVGGTNYPLVLTSVNVNGAPVSYWSIQMTATQERATAGGLIPGAVRADALTPKPRWLSVPGVLSDTGGTVAGMTQAFLWQLLTGVSIDATTPVTVPETPINPTASNATARWRMRAQFSTAPVCSYFEVNWVAATLATGVTTEPLAVSIGDPGAISSKIKAFLVSSPTDVGAAGTIGYNTIRFVRLDGAVVTPGTYTFPLTITRVGGGTVSVNLDIVVA